MTLTFRSYDASRCGYPRNEVPIMPPLEPRALGRSASASYPSAFTGAPGNVFSRGRYALFHALRTLQVGQQHNVMIPAYHCRTMVDPVVHVGAEPAFFSLRADLSPDLDSLVATAAAAPRPVKALLLPHYFGFPQDIEPVIAFCRQRGIALIEDCCHAYFGSWRGRTLGTWGDCAIASPNKFFACEDGGTFLASPPAPPAALNPRPFVDELRAVFHVTEAAWAQHKRRLGADDVRSLAPRFEAIRKQHPQWSASIEEAAGAALSHHYQAELDASRALLSSRCLLRWSNIEQLCERRRTNFMALLDGVKALRNCRPLYSHLPAGVVPYMFPLLIDRPEHRFHWLKHLGTPMYRWDELATSECAVSSDYRLRLVHLPCHQALRSADIAWLLGALTLAMRAEPDVDAAAWSPN